MPKYELFDNETGRKIIVEGDSPPTEDEVRKIFVSGETLKEIPPPKVKKPYQEAFDIARPVVEGTAATGGAIIGGATAGPPGAVLGGALGYGMGAEAMNLVGEGLGFQEPQPAIPRAMGELKTGLEYSLAGEAGGPVLSTVVRGLGRLGAKVSGGISGVGAANVRQAFKGGKDLSKGLNEKITIEDAANTARMGMEKIKTTEGALYKNRLANVKLQNDALDISPIEADVQRLLKDYDLNITLNPSAVSKMGNFNTNMSPAIQKEILNSFKSSNPDVPLYLVRPAKIGKLSKSEMDGLSDIINTFETIKSDPTAQTPMYLDIFKQRINNFYSPNKDTSAFVSSLYKSVRDVLVKQVPGYEKMVKDYETASDLLRQLREVTGLKEETQTNMNAVFSKLTTIMKQEPERGRRLIEQLNEVTGVDLPAQIAGINMSDWFPKGGFGRYLAVGEGAAMVLGHLNPKFAIMLSASSPRIQADFTRTLGAIYKQVSKFPPSKVITGLGPAVMEPQGGPKAITKGAFTEYVYNPATKALEPKE